MVAMDDGPRLAVRRSGRTRDLPPVVLVHGGPGLWDYLAPVAALVDDLTAVYRYDQRGCGSSDPSLDQSFDRHVTDLDKLRSALGLRRWAVVGHSFGATLALAYAWSYPDHISHLCYLSGVGVGDWHTAYEQERARRLTDEQRDELASLENRERSDAEERRFRALAWVTDHGDTANAARWAMEDAESRRPINYAANRLLTAETRSWTDADVVAKARAIRCPTLVLHGERDPRPASSALELAAEIKSSTSLVVQGAGHHPWREDANAVRAALRALLVRAAG